MEEKKELNQEEMNQISGGNGGNKLWNRVCKICGGIIGNDPNILPGLKCHCNDEDTTQG